MPDAPEAAEIQPERHRYVMLDPETHGFYKVVASTPKTQQELDEIVASVIADEGRVRSGVTRTILV